MTKSYFFTFYSRLSSLLVLFRPQEPFFFSLPRRNPFHLFVPSLLLHLCMAGLFLLLRSYLKFHPFIETSRLLFIPNCLFSNLITLFKHISLQPQPASSIVFTHLSNCLANLLPSLPIVCLSR